MAKDEPKILFIEDDKPLAEAISARLEEEGYNVRLARTAKEGITALNDEFFDLIILDWFTPDLNGDKFMNFVKENFPQTYVLVYSHEPDVNKECTELGADDFVLKDGIKDLLLAVVRGLRKKELKIERELGERRQKEEAYELIGTSSCMQEIRSLIASAAANDVPVLLQGETGTGKELIARNIHSQSARRKHKFFPVNCGAIAPTLLESELFGHVGGAFTGAKSRVGYFEYADKGTILLDEVSAMPQDLQIKLLRTLQEHTIRRVGSNKDVNVDVRIIAASNMSLDQLVKQGEFRSDLYFRIKVFTINIPPLREKKDDIAVLADHFMHKYTHLHRKNKISISNEAMSSLLNYDFPGNIRELENIIQSGILMSNKRGDNIVLLEDLGLEANLSAEKTTAIESWFNQSWEQATKAFERIYFTELLKRNNGNIRQAAKEAGINRQYLYQKFNSLGIDYKKFRRAKNNSE